MRVDVWSDVVCPWCYIGKRRFESALDRFRGGEVEVVWRSFELDPRAPSEREGDYATRLAVKYGTSRAHAAAMIDRMVAEGAGDGLELRFDIARTGNTFDAHRLLHLAAEQGVQGTLKERLLRATLTEGEPIGDPEALARLAIDAGLDAAEVGEVLGGDRYGDAVRTDERRAGELGIHGVPFFVVDGRYAVSGAQGPETFVSILERAWSERRPADA